MIPPLACRPPVQPARYSPRLVVVSYLANAPATPRGDRTQELVRRLDDCWDITDVISGPRAAPSMTRVAASRSPLRRLANIIHSSLLLDKFEPWSARRFRSWDPNGACALLIGYPFSPLVYAARKLDRHNIPYVVDVGDPWVLTSEQPLLHGVARLRSIRCERKLWSGATGAIVTTDSQATRLNELFPSLPVLVRPNGYPDVDIPRYVETIETAPPATLRESNVLRIAHFGMISPARIEIGTFLRRLAESGLWQGIQFHQFGSDWTGSLQSVQDSRIFVVAHEYESWARVVSFADAYDIAIVIGNQDPKQLPSKAIGYLQLPIPRLAVVADPDRDELARFAVDRSGWLVVGVEDVDAHLRIARHVARSWLPEELAPPFADSWTAVASLVDLFLRDCFCPRAAAPRFAQSGTL
jgi:hypothetical protein